VKPSALFLCRRTELILMPSRVSLGLLPSVFLVFLVSVAASVRAAQAPAPAKAAAPAAAPASAPAAAQQPVLILLYTRFYDHSHQHTTDERIQRLLPMLQKFRDRHPQSGLSALFQFSGTVSQLLAEENPGMHLVDRLKESAGRDLVDIGYTGEDEPSYLYRPKPSLLEANTPEERWTAFSEAAERFLVDYKNPITGLPVPNLSGGLKRTTEVFGDVAFVTGVVTTLGDDSPATHEVSKFAPAALMTGIPGRDPRRGIEAFAISADRFSRAMCPEPIEAPEVFWRDNVLRISDTSFTDNQPHSTDEGTEALQKFFAKLDRSHVRVVKLEIAPYKRYLTKRADGSVVVDPLEWLYYHPDSPSIPLTIHALVTQGEIEAGYQKDEAVLKWLLDEFLPANPGSRFVSVRELPKLMLSPAAEVTGAQLKELATNLNQQFSVLTMRPPEFGRSGSRFFTLAESFNLLAQALAGFHRSGSFPASVQLTPMYGPLTLPDGEGPRNGTVPVSAILETASALAPKLADTEWKTIPSNAVPAAIDVGSLHLTAAQFLRLMAQAYLDPRPDKTLTVVPISLASMASYFFPKNTPMTDLGSAWTLKPAPIDVEALKAAPAAAKK